MTNDTGFRFTGVLQSFRFQHMCLGFLEVRVAFLYIYELSNSVGQTQAWCNYSWWLLRDCSQGNAV